jgi:hypothetical protein
MVFLMMNAKRNNAWRRDSAAADEDMLRSWRSYCLFYASLEFVIGPALIVASVTLAADISPFLCWGRHLASCWFGESSAGVSRHGASIHRCRTSRSATRARRAMLAPCFFNM